MFNFPTDYTDFHRLLTLSEFFAVRPDEYKTVACNEELSVQICEICGRQKRRSGQDEQVSVQGDDLTMLNSFLMCPRITPDCILPMRFLLFQMLGG